MHGLHVGLQISSLGSLVGAVPTLKGLLPRVSSQVGLQVTLVPSYSHFTNLALETYAIAVALLSMSLELVLVSQHLVTEGASHWLPAVGS